MRINLIIQGFYCFFLFSFVFSNGSSDVESWLTTDDLYKISIDMSTKVVIDNLGEPLFIELINDDDTIITKYIYNFRTKTFNQNTLEQKNSNQSNISNGWGGSTKIQFIFEDDKLISFEEDKLTLAMSDIVKKDNGSLFSGFNFILNVIAITLNLAVLMS